MHFRDSSPKLRSGLRIEVLTFHCNHEDSKQSCHMTWGCSHGSVPSILLSPFKYFSIFTPFSGSELLWLPSETLQRIQKTGQSISLQQHLATICVRPVLHLCVELTGQTGPRLVVDNLLAFLDCIYFVLITSPCFDFRREAVFPVEFRVQQRKKGEYIYISVMRPDLPLSCLMFI